MGLELNDLIDEDVKGLSTSIDKFDSSKNCTFSTYAYPWIKESMRAALARSMPISLPRHVHKLLFKVKAIRSRMQFELGRLPTDEELQLVLQLSAEKFEIVKRAIALEMRITDSTSIETKTTQQFFHESTWETINPLDNDDRSMDHVESTEFDPTYAVNQQYLRATIMNLLLTLPIEEAGAIYLKLGLHEIKSNFSILSVHPTSSETFQEVLNRIRQESVEARNILYHKALRRLRRRILSNNKKYPDRIMDDSFSKFEAVV